jgi:hypothetical protein
VERDKKRPLFPIPTFCHSDDALKLPTRTTHHAPRTTLFVRTGEEGEA